MELSRQQAETIALVSLAWLAAEDRLWTEFLASTGTDADTARDSAGNPEFLASVLDFILSEDRRVIDLCAQSGLRTAEPLAARQRLPGGRDVHWT